MQCKFFKITTLELADLHKTININYWNILGKNVINVAFVFLFYVKCMTRTHPHITLNLIFS